jgi:hypothetical protein
VKNDWKVVAFNHLIWYNTGHKRKEIRNGHSQAVNSET